MKKTKAYYVDINIGGMRWEWIKAICRGHVRLVTDASKIIPIKEQNDDS